MTRLSPNHNYAADECIAHMHIPTLAEKIRASECFDKTVLVAAHQAALHDAYILEMASHPVNASPVTPVSPTSSIGGLKTVSLKQLKTGKVYRNRVLHGTLCMKALCTKGVSGLAVVNVLEDEEGKATPICLSNALGENYSSAQAQRIYPQGSRVAVREPYLTRFPDGEVGLLVEKPADLVFLWVPEVTESILENHANNGEEKTPSKEDLSAHANGGIVHGNGYAFAGNESKVQEGGDVNTLGAVADGTHDSSCCNDEAPTAGENANRELSFEDILALRGEGGRDVTGENGDKEATEWREEGGEEGKVTEKVAPETQTDVGSAEAAEKIEAANIVVAVEGVAGRAEEAAAKVESVDEEAATKEESEEEEDTTTAAPLASGEETSARLRIRGNEYFARAEYKLAAEMYSRAVARASGEEEQQLALSNRAEAWLRLGRSKAALEDAGATLHMLGGGGGVAAAKALFRKGRALMGLRRYEEAMGVLEQVLEAAPSDRHLREEAITCRERLKRSTKPGKRQRAAASRRQYTQLPPP